jgi:hypothetical protein
LYRRKVMYVTVSLNGANKLEEKLMKEK